MTSVVAVKNTVLKQDFLQLEWGVRNKFHLRYIVVKKTGEVSIWLNDDLENPENMKHSFFLQGEESVVTKSNTGKKICFVIKMVDFRQNKKKYTFGCKSEDERNEWMSVFSNVVHGVV